MENRNLIERLKQKNEELERSNEKLIKLSIQDGLTGLYNHRYFQEAIELEVSRSSRSGCSFSLLFLDVDFFKKYNDANGHQEGDNLLRILAELVKRRLRKTDIVARYGGEEIVIILPGMTKDSAVYVAGILRQHVEEYKFKGGETQPLGKVTISIGVSTFPEDGRDAHAQIKYADQALYKAKESGRNTVC